MDFNKWIFMLAVFVIIALAGCVQDKAGNLSNSQVDHIQISDAYFPLSEGAYWIYQGTVTWEDAGEVKSESLEWMMEVIDVIDRGDVVGYRMLGHPGDLAWYEIGKKPSEYAIIRAGSGSYYMSDLDSLERLKDQNDILGFLVSEDQILLDTPLSPGKRFCGEEYITNPYGDYCWVVGSQEKVILDKLLGEGRSEQISGFSIRYLTNPDHTIITFVPGVGITNYVYSHHGVLSEVDLQLSEYSIGR